MNEKIQSIFNDLKKKADEIIISKYGVEPRMNGKETTYEIYAKDEETYDSEEFPLFDEKTNRHYRRVIVHADKEPGETLEALAKEIRGCEMNNMGYLIEKEDAEIKNDASLSPDTKAMLKALNRQNLILLDIDATLNKIDDDIMCLSDTEG